MPVRAGLVDVKAFFKGQTQYNICAGSWPVFSVAHPWVGLLRRDPFSPSEQRAARDFERQLDLCLAPL